MIIEKILATAAVFLLFMAVLAFKVRRSPQSCDGACGACGDFRSCSRKEKFAPPISGKPGGCAGCS